MENKNDNVEKEAHVVSVMTDKHKETCAVVRDEKDGRLLPHQIRRPRLTKGEKNHRKHQATEEGSSDKRSEISCRHQNFFLKKITHYVNFGILLCVKTTSLRPDAVMEEHVFSDMLRPRRSPAR